MTTLDATTLFEREVGSPGDVDGDGFPDLVVGFPSRTATPVACRHGDASVGDGGPVTLHGAVEVHAGGANGASVAAKWTLLPPDGTAVDVRGHARAPLTRVLARPKMGAGPHVILGGGPCGLAAAWHLARRGAKPLVLEREELVGGLCATHERGGWRFDLGGHRFVSGDAELSRWVEDLLGSELLEQERRSVVLHEGRRFRYPLEAVDLVRNLGVRENVRGRRRLRARAPRPPLRAPRGGELRGLGRRTLRATALRALLRPLHREALGPRSRAASRPTGRPSASRSST